MKTLSGPAVQRAIETALVEDGAWEDITTASLIDPEQRAVAVAFAKEDGYLAGIEVFSSVFKAVDPGISVTRKLSDGSIMWDGDEIATIEGSAASILRAERVALNFLQRLSGIATVTARFVQAVAGLPVKIVDTRKTTPGLRFLEKYAVRVGGGYNHRYNLMDGVLIKDNHLAAIRARGLKIADAIALTRQQAPHTIKIQIEVESVAEAEEAIQGGADLILLDNMSPEDMARAVQIARGKVLTEASGGVRLDTVRQIAEVGVDLISVGALTHSAKALDISLEFQVC
ncbi:MAG: carboxylating nicotinate-nucleotide diphosphorylase [Dehalococcoidia bacterium]|nr:carboxylating nicotinate-nucleotide diphosphorylase [Dehalococcoidia bacterium]